MFAAYVRHVSKVVAMLKLSVAELQAFFALPICRPEHHLFNNVLNIT